MKDVLPTHHCFDDALDFIAARLGRDASARHLLLVHGIALAPAGQHEGEPFAHAWVEEQGVVWDSGILDGVPVHYSVERDDFYASLRIQCFTRYTVREAWLENHRSGHYGPWKDEYRALCGARRVLGAVQGRAA
jgi:hypothetical protein